MGKRQRITHIHASHTDPASQAGCECKPQTRVCPRHDAPAYADNMARHATDSIPHQTSAERYHSGNGWGR